MVQFNFGKGFDKFNDWLKIVETIVKCETLQLIRFLFGLFY
jgi:hypothetical protein